MKVSSKSKDRVNPEEGVHHARIISIIDIGTQIDKTYNKSNRKVRITYELVNTGHVFDEDKGEQPFVIGRTYTASLSDRAALKKDLEAWMGRKLKDEEKEEFDLFSIVNTTGQLQVVYNEHEGVTYANIGSLMAMQKADAKKVKKAQNEIVTFDLDDFNEETFVSLPEWIQEVIKESPEYNEAVFGASSKEEKADDLPWEGETESKKKKKKKKNKKKGKGDSKSDLEKELFG